VCGEVVPGVRSDGVPLQLRRVLEAENLIVDFEADEISEIKRATALVWTPEAGQHVGEISHENGDVSCPLVGWISGFRSGPPSMSRAGNIGSVQFFACRLKNEGTSSGVPITVTSVSSRRLSK